MRTAFLKKAKVVVIESIICSLLALSVLSLFSLRGGYSLFTSVFAWLLAHLGPLYPVVLMLFDPWSEMSVIACLVWSGVAALLMAAILAYLIRPGPFTAVVSFIGLAIWFCLGMGGVLIGI